MTIVYMVYYGDAKCLLGRKDLDICAQAVTCAAHSCDRPMFSNEHNFMYSQLYKLKLK